MDTFIHSPELSFYSGGLAFEALSYREIYSQKLWVGIICKKLKYISISDHLENTLNAINISKIITFK